MNVDPIALIVGFIVSGAGFVLFTYGRRNGRFPHLAAGIPLIVVPFFLPPLFSAIALAGMGLILWIATRHFGL
jgi:hypothetical protein